jgi:hypothetical protein
MSRLIPLGLVVALLVPLVGCGDGDADINTEPTMITKEMDPEPQPTTVAQKFVSLSYQGALLQSNHPLNDSLFTYLEGPWVGESITVADTVLIESTTAESDTGYTATVEMPKAVSVTPWSVSQLGTNVMRTVEVRGGKVVSGPHVVGWPAFREHVMGLQEVENRESFLNEVATHLGVTPPPAS